jgi:hypothetical protein
MHSGDDHQWQMPAIPRAFLSCFRSVPMLERCIHSWDFHTAHLKSSIPIETVVNQIDEVACSVDQVIENFRFD